MGKKDKKRLFLAIDLPDELKTELSYFQDRWRDFPGKWAQREQLHITLSFLGDVATLHIDEVTATISDVVEKHEPLELVVEKTVFAPDKKKPRMIWARVGESAKLSHLYSDIRSALTSLPFKVHGQRPSFRPHITLSRFNSMHLREWRENQLPPLEEEIGYDFIVDTLTLYESQLRRGGAEHFVLQSFMLSE